MPTEVLLLVLLLIICLILLVVVYKDSKSTKRRRKRAKSKYNESNGTLDESAQQALEELEQIPEEERDAIDNFQEGAIIENNIFEGNMENTNNEEARNLRDRMILNFTNTLLDMADRANYNGVFEDNVRDTPGFIINHIDNFNNRVREITNNRIRNIREHLGGWGNGGGLAMFMQTDDENGNGFFNMNVVIRDAYDREFANIFDNGLFGNNNDDFDNNIEAWMNFIDVYDNTRPEIQENIIENRRETAAANARNRREFTEQYTERAIENTEDPQNVHDSKVNQDLRTTLERLKQQAPRGISPTQSITEARNYINANFIGTKQDKAMRVLNMIAQGNRITSLGSKEDEVFMYTWERSNHPNNEEQQDIIRNAIVDSLIDCFEHGNMVCINGRCGRVLASLATIDFDDNVGAVNTFENYKNEIFREANKIIQSEIDKAKESSDAEIKAVGKSYEDPNIETNQAAEERFQNIVKGKLDIMLERYSNKLNHQEIENMRKDIYAGIY